jgi:homeobox protein cut-like
MDALSKECRKTVKGYQEEIDNLTRRCKASEQAYAVVCNKLVELPDPASLLAACQRRIEAQNAQLAKVFETVEKVNSELEEANQSNASYKKQLADLQKSSSTNAAGEFSNEEREELIQLRKEVAEYEVEFRSLKNQDITIRKLEEKILELQTAGAESIENSIAKAREELAMTEGRRAAEALEREAALEAKLQTLELQLRSERAGREATENVMLQADEGLCRREAAWDAQRQILVHDNERVRESLQTVSRERDELRMKLSALNNTTTANASITTPPPSGNFSKQDLMLERNAYEAEVSWKYTCKTR